MRIRGISLISLLGFLLRGASSADADISSENLACVTLQTYSAQGCTGTATTQQFTTYTEPGHSECKAETKMNKTLFSFNNRYCKLSSTPETFQQTMYLFDQQNDCTPFLGLDLFKLDITFSVDECALGYYKLVSCVAGSCEANETLPDFGNGHLDQQNGTMGSTDGMESLGNATDTGGNVTDLPPPPDTSLGEIKKLCKKSYIAKHNDSDCYLTCEPGTCCFLEGMDSCSNNTEVCALYKGCEDILSSNNTDANGTLSNSNITDMGVNGTEDGSVNTTIFGNETSVGGNDTAVDINGTSALESNGTTTGDVGNTTDSGLNGTASSDQNATGTNGTSSVGGHSILGSIGNAIDAITNGTMNNILGNVTIPGTALGIINSTTPWENGPGTINVTAPGTNDTAAAGGGTTTKPVNPMGNSAGAATGGDNPPLPDNSQGGPAVVCAPPYRKANGNVPCRLTCKPGACCFSSSADSCADNTETCALYALCEKILASRLLLRF
mmetsp:Transcript_5679/g.8363  ORF Transcript_5679/g.8363 Transcript_5679/m.8363 type:complete len:497 (-) Transcript_5679:386-1876(-)